MSVNVYLVVFFFENKLFLLLKLNKLTRVKLPEWMQLYLEGNWLIWRKMERTGLSTTPEECLWSSGRIYHVTSAWSIPKPCGCTARSSWENLERLDDLREFVYQKPGIDWCFLSSRCKWRITLKRIQFRWMAREWMLNVSWGQEILLRSSMMNSCGTTCLCWTTRRPWAGLLITRLEQGREESASQSPAGR